FVRRVGSYLAFFHLGAAGGRGMFLVMVLLPASLTAAVALALRTARRALARGVAPAGALGRALAAVALVFAALLAGELWRTRAERAPEAEPPGTLLEYFRRYPW